MTSQFFGLNIAASGLRAANAALNTTANNISNANTDGYSRQKVSQEATSDRTRHFLVTFSKRTTTTALLSST